MSTVMNEDQWWPSWTAEMETCNEARGALHYFYGVQDQLSLLDEQGDTRHLKQKEVTVYGAQHKLGNPL